jgi:hypothetical protein
MIPERRLCDLRRSLPTWELTTQVVTLKRKGAERDS